MNILIVEDDPDSRLMMQTILESAQHQVISAPNGVRALLSARKERPDLIISDIMMAEMDGFELCYALKHDHQLQHIPLIFCTATYVESADERLALQLGAERFILKPIEPQRLLDVVAEFETDAQSTCTMPIEAEKTSLKHADFLQQYQPRISHKLEQKTRELELYKNIYHNSSDLFCILSPSGSVLQANPAFESFFSCSEEHLRLLNLSDYLLDPTMSDLLYKVQSKETFQAEFKAETPAGSRVCLDISALPFLDENGALSAIMIQARDVTERSQHAEELEMLRHLIDISNDAFFVIRDDNARFEYVNERACERLGYTRAELMNLSVVDIVQDFPSMEEWYKHVEAMRKNPAAVFESVHIRKDGSHLPVEVSVMHDQSQNHTGLISAVARDITEHLQAREQQKKLEAKLNQTRTMEALGTLAGGVAHDFNNIIGAISGYTEMAQRSLDTPAKARSCLTQVMNAAQRARELVGQILAFSRSRRHTLSAINLQDIVYEVVELLRPDIGERIKIETNIDTSCSAVMADPVQMHQVIMNLCTNALHAMEEQDQGTMRISLRNTTLPPTNAPENINLAPGFYVELQVLDTGSGIEEEARQRIFEPYFSTRKERGGTGLGLAVVHGIIEDFNGSISLESSPGQGAAFNVLLPAADEEKCTVHKINPAKHQSAPTHAGNSAGAKHVLVVDDEDHIANLIKKMLERHGYIVTCTTSSPHALEVFKKRRDMFDMVITDYAMPEMSGIELARRVRNIRSDIPVLLCSGYYAGKEYNSAQEAGIEMVLYKPLQDYQLVLAVDNILNT